MKHASTRITRALLVPLALLALFLVGCDAAGPQADASLRYDGETVFRALMFGQGEVAQLFPEIWADEAAILQEARKRMSEQDLEVFDASLKAAEGFWEKLVAAIGEADPTFFDRFAEATQSGDHLVILAALEEARDQLVVGMAAVLGVETKALQADIDVLMANPEQFAEAGKGSDIVIESATARVVDTALLEPGALVLAQYRQVANYLYFYIHTYYNLWPTPILFLYQARTQDGSSQLADDLYIDLIARRLHR